MSERLRLQYLEAIGIESFAPRWVLPGARASSQCVLPSAAPEHQTPEPSPGPAEPQRHQPIGALVDSLLGEAPKPQRKAVETPVEKQSDLPAVHQSRSAAFVLTFWRVHPQVMVIDSRQPKALPTETLLRSIVLANGLADKLPAMETQAWPLPGGGDQSWEAARETLQAFLESRLLSDPVRYLVLMGGDAARAILPAEAVANLSSEPVHALAEPGAEPDISDRYGQVVPLDAFACEAILTPSLAQLLLQPSLKAGLWTRLLPLRELAPNG